MQKYRPLGCFWFSFFFFIYLVGTLHINEHTMQTVENTIDLAQCKFPSVHTKLYDALRANMLTLAYVLSPTALFVCLIYLHFAMSFFLLFFPFFSCYYSIYSTFYHFKCIVSYGNQISFYQYFLHKSPSNIMTENNIHLYNLEQCEYYRQPIFIYGSEVLK